MRSTSNVRLPIGGAAKAAGTCLIVMMPFVVCGQDSADGLQFEAASVRLHTVASPSTGRSGIEETPGLIRIENLSLKVVLQLAYGVKDFQITGPGWLDTVSIDITAKPPAVSGPKSTAPLDVDELRVLLQALLEDRFKLATHMEDRTVPAYSLVAAKPKLRRADPENPTRWKEGPGPDGKDPRLTNPMLSRLVTFQNVTIAQFAEALSWIGSDLSLGSPVLDETGLNGAWDFSLSFSSAGLLRRSADDGDLGQTEEPNGALSIFDAIDKQLGLKLEMHKRPIPVLVIDHIEEKPTDN